MAHLNHPSSRIIVKNFGTNSSVDMDGKILWLHHSLQITSWLNFLFVTSNAWTRCLIEVLTFKSVLQNLWKDDWLTSLTWSTFHPHHPIIRCHLFVFMQSLKYRFCSCRFSSASGILGNGLHTWPYLMELEWNDYSSLGCNVQRIFS